MKKNHRLSLKSIVILFSALAVVAGGCYFWFRSQRTASESSTASLHTVTRKDVTHRLFLAGKIRPASSMVIATQMAGWLVELPVKEGTRVKAGDLLAVLRLEASGQQEVIQKRAEVDRLALEVTSLESRLSEKNSVRELLASALVAKEQDELNAKKLELSAARRRLALLEEEIGLKAKAPRAKQDTIYVRAPSNGIVTLIAKTVGDFVGPGATANAASDRNIMVLADLSALTVRTRVLEADLRYVSKDQTAIVRLDAYQDKEYSGKVIHVGGQGRTDDRGGYTYFDVEVAIENPDGTLRPEMNAMVELVFQKRENALSLPVTAVVVLPDGAFVRKPDKKAKEGFTEVPVKVGVVTEEDVEILSGLNEGEQVLEIDFAKLDLNKNGPTSQQKGRSSKI